MLPGLLPIDSENCTKIKIPTQCNNVIKSGLCNCFKFTDTPPFGAQNYLEYGRNFIDLLHRLGFSYKQTKQVPCKTDVEAQYKFLEDLTSLVEHTKDNEAVIYFADGVHPTHNTRSTHAWIEKGTERE